MTAAGRREARGGAKRTFEQNGCGSGGRPGARWDNGDCMGPGLSTPGGEPGTVVGGGAEEATDSESVAPGGSTSILPESPDNSPATCCRKADLLHWNSARRCHTPGTTQSHQPCNTDQRKVRCSPGFLPCRRKANTTTARSSDSSSTRARCRGATRVQPSAVSLEGETITQPSIVLL